MRTKIKNIIAIIFLVFGLFVITGANVSAADCSTGPGQPRLIEDPRTHLCVPVPNGSPGVAGALSINDLVVRIINVLLAIAAIVAVLFIVIGGFRYITSAGNEDQAKKGRHTVVNALIGLAIVILAYALVSIVNNAVSNCGGILTRIGIVC